MSDVFITGLMAIIITQFIKTLIEYNKTGFFSLKMLFQNGGMPSSHVAAMTAVTGGILFEQGVSALFGLSVILTLIIINDALKVRRQTGIQAEIINKIMKIDHIQHERLTKNIGHTLSQVIVGAILGIVISLLIYSI
ncbi:MAG: divergent PAP2 family protein [Candidatus Woesearchaeota archaeon]